ncbi:MAG: T9SS C-terminal target domain-containing protein [Calditrichaeota bacterium]|nr:MAG: T9SS C-terminal target domain-containing protein [Calditrichota bacterium]
MIFLGVSLSVQAQISQNVTLIGRWPDGPCEAVAVNGTYAYIGKGGSLDIVDVSIPENPKRTGNLITPGFVADLAVQGDLVFIANRNRGLRITNVSDPTAPVEKGAFKTPGGAREVLVSDSQAYILTWSDGLNPFNPETLIRFNLPKPAHVKLTIYNLLGQKIRVLLDEYKPAGFHKVSWDGRDQHGFLAPSGLYLYRIKAGEFEKTLKMILLR